MKSITKFFIIFVPSVLIGVFCTPILAIIFCISIGFSLENKTT